MKTLIIIKPNFINSEKYNNAIKDIKKKIWKIIIKKDFIYNNEIIQWFYWKYINKEDFFKKLENKSWEILIVETSLTFPWVRRIIWSNKQEKWTLKNKYAQDLFNNSFHTSNSLRDFRHEIKILWINWLIKKYLKSK